MQPSLCACPLCWPPLQVTALGIVSIFDQILDGLPDGEREAGEPRPSAGLSALASHLSSPAASLPALAAPAGPPVAGALPAAHRSSRKLWLPRSDFW